MVEQKKRKALDAAEKLFVIKGFSRTTVNDISKASGIHEASIYAYFKNKKNILFAIYGGYIERAVQDLQEHFLGMKEPGPKLRKSIWHFLNDFKKYPDFGKIWMMVQHVGPDFHQSEYYRFQYEYSRLMLDTIEEGQEEGFFRADVPPRLIRNLALGGGAFTVIKLIITKKDIEPVVSSDRIYSLLVEAVGVAQGENGIKWKKGSISRADFRRNQIITTAAKLFAQKGFSNTTISQIAKEANLGDATLYEYFDRKESILIDIAEPYMDDLIHAKEPLFLKDESTAAGKELRRLIWTWIWLVCLNRDFACVMALELFKNEKYYSSKSYANYAVYLEKIQNVIRRGQEEGFFVQDIHYETYLNMLFGALDQYSLSQIIAKRPQAGIGELNSLVDSLLRAIKVRQKG